MFRATTIMVVLCCAVFGGGSAYLTHFAPEDGFFGVFVESDQKSNIVFTGDVMLARKVETLSKERGVDYPFSRLEGIANDAYLVFNFESAVAVPHRPTPYHTFQFSTATTSLPALKRAGFTHASLANNHAFDHGTKGFAAARTALAGAGIDAFGDPNALSSSSVTYIEIEGGTVAVVGLHTLARNPTAAELRAVFEDASAHSDVQVAFIHWGTEYDLIASPAQEATAKRLIEAGADVVVGHHPHVVQNIAYIDGVPVFYSLGNAVFDQYFSQDVQQGLLVKLTLRGDELRFDLLPITSLDAQSAPRLMEGTERQVFLDRLALRSDPRLQNAIAAGVVEVETLLAFE